MERMGPTKEDILCRTWRSRLFLARGIHEKELVRGYTFYQMDSKCYRPLQLPEGESRIDVRELLQPYRDQLKFTVLGRETRNSFKSTGNAGGKRAFRSAAERRKHKAPGLPLNSSIFTLMNGWRYATFQ